MGSTGPRLAGTRLYSYLGVESRARDSSSSETIMPVGDHLTSGGSLRAAALGLASEHGVYTYLFARVVAVPVQIALRTYDVDALPARLRVETRAVHEGRKLVFTEGEARGADGGEGIVAVAAIIWSVIGPAQGVDAAPERAATPTEMPAFDLAAAVGVDVHPDGVRLQIASVTPEIAGPGGVLHAGALQVLSEECALRAASTELDTSEVRTVECVVNFVAAARGGPFVATAERVGTEDRVVDLRVSVRDEGSGGRLCSYAFVRAGARGS